MSFLHKYQATSNIVEYNNHIYSPQKNLVDIFNLWLTTTHSTKQPLTPGKASGILKKHKEQLKPIQVRYDISYAPYLSTLYCYKDTIFPKIMIILANTYDPGNNELKEKIERELRWKTWNINILYDLSQKSYGK